MTKPVVFNLNLGPEALGEFLIKAAGTERLEFNTIFVASVTDDGGLHKTHFSGVLLGEYAIYRLLCVADTQEQVDKLKEVLTTEKVNFRKSGFVAVAR